MSPDSIGLAAAFIGGLASFFSPCTLPVLPTYLSFVQGRNSRGRPSHSSRPLWYAALFFVLGYSTLFISLGVGSTFIGSLLFDNQQLLQLICGAIITVFGLSMLWNRKRDSDSCSLPRENRRSQHSAYVLGLVFAFGKAPCAGPILGSILAFSAASQSPAFAASLLGMYCVGFAVPIVLTTLMTDLPLFKSGQGVKRQRWLRRLSGWFLLALGLLMMSGQLAWLSYWGIKWFPSLGRLG